MAVDAAIAEKYCDVTWTSHYVMFVYFRKESFILACKLITLWIRCWHCGVMVGRAMRAVLAIIVFHASCFWADKAVVFVPKGE